MTSAVSPSSDLETLLSRHRVLVTVGAGGVGKTTVAAALALSAAQSGRRTLCLTIDPARRLASSLGLESFPREEMEVPREFLAQHGVTLSAPLTVMMLDARATFDGLIRQFSASERDAERIINHEVYRHLASNLAGTQAYMAMEKVLAVLDDDRYDLIVLDTPPSARALDFFDAPRKMSEILDSPATRALVRAIDRGRKLRFGVLAAGLQRALKGLEKVTGTRLISDVAELLGQMNGLFGGFASRAQQVDRRLHGEEFGYVLVTSPKPRTISDARALRRQMKERGLRLRALTVNRVAQPGLAGAKSSDLGQLSALSQAGQDVALELAEEQSQSRTAQIARCRSLLAELDDQVFSVFLPAFAEDVHRPEKLMQVAQLLRGAATQRRSRAS